jgi:hypothetical protein
MANWYLAIQFACVILAAVFFAEINDVIEPDMSWHWHQQAGQLLLSSIHFSHPVNQPAATGWLDADSAFTLEQAQWYYECWYALAELAWPEQAIFAATIDAIARLSFSRGIMSRNFYFEAWGLKHWQPAPWQLVEVAGRQYGLAIVLRVHNDDVDLMLLTPVETVGGKALEHGYTLNCRFDRLRPFSMAQTPDRLSA